jgi:hypothetical protein
MRTAAQDGARDGSGTLIVALSSDAINMNNHDTRILSQTILENEYEINGVLKPRLARALPEVSADRLV